MFRLVAVCEHFLYNTRYHLHDSGILYVYKQTHVRYIITLYYRLYTEAACGFPHQECCNVWRHTDRALGVPLLTFGSLVLSISYRGDRSLGNKARKPKHNSWGYIAWPAFVTEEAALCLLGKSEPVAMMSGLDLLIMLVEILRWLEWGEKATKWTVIQVKKMFFYVMQTE